MYQPSGPEKDPVSFNHPATQTPNGRRNSSNISSQVFCDSLSSAAQHDTRKLSPRPRSDISLGDDTPSSISEDDTDWGEDDIRDSPQSSRLYNFLKDGDLDRGEVRRIIVTPKLSPFKNQLVDHMMEEFWLIFNKENEIK